MSTVIIAYDLMSESPTDQNKKTAQILSLLRLISDQSIVPVKILNTAFLVETTNSVQGIRDGLRVFLDANDHLFVGKVDSNWAAYNIPQVKPFQK